MNYRTLENTMRNLPCFSLQQIKIFNPNFLRGNFKVWNEKGYINRVSKGWYVFSSFENSEESLFYISNQIYKPSYISMESALRYYNLIPEGVFITTACSTKKTQTLEGERGTFHYYHIKPEIMRGYDVKKMDGISFYIAKVEKAICDFFYLKPQMNIKELEDLRIDYDCLKDITTEKKLLSCSRDFKSKKVEKTMEILISLLK